MDIEKYFVNEDIRANKVMLILEDGSKYGIVSIDEALKIADDSGLDLVQVAEANNGNPVICKIIDFGKLKYKQSKNTKKSHNEVMKEIRFHYNTGQRDLDIKNKKVFEFLKKKYKVLYHMELKGREKYMTDNALAKFNSNVNLFLGLASWNSPNVTSEGISVILSPISSKK
jgi:translation initiation factor IF-3